MAVQRAHLPLVDVIKAVAAQLIVLHHLAWFGPMSDVAVQLSPLVDGMRGWLAEYGRYAVAAFLAIGGFLAAQALPMGGLPTGQSPWRLVVQRYVRLIVPFAAALVLAVLCAWLARQWMAHESIGSPPRLDQFLAHLLLLNGVLGVESLSAGVWYVAIDFQLYALFVALLWLVGRTKCRPASAEFASIALVAGIALASLLHFSRDDSWDASALYFFGAYGFGILGGWATRSLRPLPLLLALVLIGGSALAFDFRGRIAVALLTALALAWAQLQPWLCARPLFSTQGWTYLGRTSYALFLVHFPICLIVNALFTRYAPDSPALNLLGVVVAWAASNVAAFPFHRHVEANLTPRLLRLAGSGVR
jgi:peptidoglycan/LPS O-acetylase OafA/YrhL